MKELVIISDVHGKYDRYTDITEENEYTLQIGDMGLDYQYLLDNIDPAKHKFFGGNHDNYDQYDSIPHALGDFGSYHHVVNFFYIRGAFSIDWKYRIIEETIAKNKDNPYKYRKLWWDNEQLDYDSMLKAYDAYKLAKPEIMITHTFPSEVTKDPNLVGDRDVLSKFGYNKDTFTTNTQELLQQCWDYHKPRLWIGGHFHRNWQAVKHGTTFICREELGKIRLDKNGNLR